MRPESIDDDHNKSPYQATLCLQLQVRKGRDSLTVSLPTPMVQLTTEIVMLPLEIPDSPRFKTPHDIQNQTRLQGKLAYGCQAGRKGFAHHAVAHGIYCTMLFATHENRSQAFYR